jgi:F0F1-type ATP synthase membrane subunit b/b'
MIRSLNGVVLAVIAAVVIVLASMSMFVVDPTEQAYQAPASRLTGPASSPPR